MTTGLGSRRATSSTAGPRPSDVMARLAALVNRQRKRTRIGRTDRPEPRPSRTQRSPFRTRFLSGGDRMRRRLWLQGRSWWAPLPRGRVRRDASLRAGLSERSCVTFALCGSEHAVGSLTAAGTAFGEQRHRRVAVLAGLQAPLRLRFGQASPPPIVSRCAEPANARALICSPCRKPVWLLEPTRYRRSARRTRRRSFWSTCDPGGASAAGPRKTPTARRGS